ncbi:hypothetical protein [Sphingomicrobium sediminis]|uniref:Uncharacterized protein n=1 Tax=Sphingomicrobium sediminis TaxID=2950949 RepID=A0A9X2EF93_9SPHN|nr:hypothetical protein [Sphingomicrobium sediminis]MCM8556890.1 hypothetical protein [Sphingomicrobium sediminis]
MTNPAQNLFDGTFKTVQDHPILTAAIGGALLALAGSAIAVRRRIELNRLDEATEEEIEEQIQVGAIAY